ncbi:50S ribosomal protein L11 methyltransferase [Sandarakinorhabdus rubra]|uniref:50S ribosomal protein L11 methyltransferase n=1 Tax=Sandarakinorhabdus rubra TaxID=2672568 RepID=UPI0013DA15D5|nr:50S ribosomal protein L11 methyltransferase [Sandarakinorhabdus rubra]
MTWTLSFWCNRAEAEALPDLADILPLDEPPTLNAEEPDPARPDEWLVTAYFADWPDNTTVAQITGLFTSARDIAVTPLPEADWTTLSQRGLAPVRAGRFVVHTADHRQAARTGDWGLAIEAGLAFGTGQHATTHGCLKALARLGKRRRFGRIADLGTGTGVLAMAALRANRSAQVIASDIDPVAIDVARENLRRNQLAHGSCAGRIATAVAPGLSAPALRQMAPYDLVLANILAPPLIALARDVSAAMAPGGVLVMAGLLHHQQRAVANAYRRHTLVPVWPMDRQAEWPCLVLVKKGG